MDVGEFLIFQILLRPSRKQLDAPRRDTIAEVLRNADYFTTLSGKRHLSKPPTDFGFQTQCFAVVTHQITTSDLARISGIWLTAMHLPRFCQKAAFHILTSMR